MFAYSAAAVSLVQFVGARGVGAILDLVHDLQLGGAALAGVAAIGLSSLTGNRPASAAAPLGGGVE